MSSVISVRNDGPVWVVTLDAPGRKNAIPNADWAVLTAALRRFAADPAGKVLVIRGAGSDFCSGADLGGDEVDELSGVVAARAWMQPVGEAATTLHRLAKPTVAAVDGVAVGAGMNLALGCDIVVATDRARFSEIFARRGLTLDFGGTWLLPRMIGLARAREIALTGRFVDAAEAERIGLVSRVVAPDQLDAAVDVTTAALLAGAPLAQRFIKTALDRSSSMDFEQAVEFETQTQSVLLGSDDFREALGAFAEKRPAEFDGR